MDLLGTDLASGNYAPLPEAVISAVVADWPAGHPVVLGRRSIG
ncbi:hypothetical protein [Amycolatopsis sp. NPDC051102]